MSDCSLRVERYALTNPVDPSRPSGDFLRVGAVDLGSFRDLVDVEFQQAKGIAYDMRQMWYTGSPYGAEILELARRVRGDNIERPPIYPQANKHKEK